MNWLRIDKSFDAAKVRSSEPALECLVELAERLRADGSILESLIADGSAATNTDTAPPPPTPAEAAPDPESTPSG